MNDSTGIAPPSPEVPAAPAVVATAPPAAEVWPADYNSYTLLGKVGQGAFASVWRAECLLNHRGIEKEDDNHNDNDTDNQSRRKGDTTTVDGQNVVGGDQQEAAAAAATKDSNDITSAARGEEEGQSNESKENNKEEEKQLCAIKILDLEHVDTNFGGEFHFHFAAHGKVKVSLKLTKRNNLFCCERSK